MFKFAGRESLQLTVQNTLKNKLSMSYLVNLWMGLISSASTLQKDKLNRVMKSNQEN